MDEDCRGICRSINNLAVPYEKKTSIVSTGNFAVILRARTVSAMSREPPEAHLCCIALLNLTFAAEAVESPIATSSPLRCSRDSESVPDACGREDDDDERVFPPEHGTYGRSRARLSLGRGIHQERHFGR